MEDEKKYTIKEKLLKEAKELAESDDLATAFNRMNQLKKQWRRYSSEEESFFDAQLTEEFEKYVDKVSAKESEIIKAIEDKKNDIISKAKAVLSETNMNKASSMMKQLLDEWKSSGRTTKDLDDELWAKFKEIRDSFYDKRSAYYKELEEKFSASKALKQDLIEKAKEANKLENMRELTNRMNELMDEWKKAGYAGKENDDALWNEFNTERKAFYAKRKAYYDAIKEVYAEKTAQKKELIAIAKRNLAISEFSDKEVNEMNELRKKWKEIGSAGKDNEETLWKEFDEIMNRYYENLKFYR